MEFSKERAILVASVAVAGTVAIVAVLAWPAPTRPDPPLEAQAGAKGVRINLVEPPKPVVTRTGPLDVGLSEAALAMAKGREAPPTRFTPMAPASAPADRRAPVETTPLLVEDDAVRPPDDLDEARERAADDRRERERWRRENEEDARRAEWERERRAEDRRWRDARDDDRYARPPERW